MNQRNRLVEQNRQQSLAAWAKKSAGSSSSGGGRKTVQVTVENSLVNGATVVIGWISGITFTREDGSTGIITAQDAIIRTGVTGNSGRVNIPLEREWEITDHTSGSPVKRYAPIISYNGTTLTGLKSNTLMSNVATPVLNPITTAIAEVEPTRALHEIPTSEQDEIFGYVEEWADTQLSTEDRQRIIRGQRIPGQRYELLARPLQNVNVLYEGLNLATREQVINPVQQLFVQVSQQVVALPLISGLDTFGKYVGDRRRGAVAAATAGEFGPTTADLKEIQRALGIVISDPTVKAQLLRNLYTQNLTLQEVEQFLEDNQGSISTGQEQCCPTAIVNVISIDTNGVFTIKSEDQLVEPVPNSGEYPGTLIVKSTSGFTRDVTETKFDITLGNETEVDTGWTYTAPVGATLGAANLTKFIAGNTYQLEVTTKNNKKQLSTKLLAQLNRQTGIIEFLARVSGTIISPVKAAGDDGDTTPAEVQFVAGGADRNGNFIPTAGSPPVTLTLLQDPIGGRPAWSDNTITLYWEGRDWVIENQDGDIIAIGGDRDEPFGQFTAGRPPAVTGLIQLPQ